jgi:pimeloyl-ACP methyl ester carboxylesterase
MKLIGLCGCMVMAFGTGCASQAQPPAETAFVFTAKSGEEVEAFRGELSVAENRAHKDSREIPIGYVRFPATGESPGAPIIYLSGGPGGSGISTAKGRRFPLFMAMREFGDVIALDQRGTGASDDTPRCTSDVVMPADQNIQAETALALVRQSIDQCEAFWREAGVDIEGYTTVENARDLEALRKHLGAEKITLWGISYGTHLAFAALKEKQLHGRIERLILASAEGLDQTVKFPSRTDAYFDRLQAVIDTQPEAKAAYRDIKALMARVHAKLEAAPVMVQLSNKDGSSADYLLRKETMQRVASAMISDPGRAVMLLQLYSAADAGFYDPLVGLLQRFETPGEPVEWGVMSLAMDVASGIGDERLAQVEREAQTALIGDFLNFPMPHMRGVLGGLDLGEEFREPPVSDVPALLLTGTLDGRTYPDSQQEAVSGLTNVKTVTVVNAGHNLFMTSPEVTSVIQRFMRGEEIVVEEIEVIAPQFVSQH